MSDGVAATVLFSVKTEYSIATFDRGTIIGEKSGFCIRIHVHHIQLDDCSEGAALLRYSSSFLNGALYPLLSAFGKVGVLTDYCNSCRICVSQILHFCMLRTGAGRPVSRFGA